MSSALRAITSRIAAWPIWLKVVSAALVAALVVAAVAIPVTLRLRGQPTSAARRTGATTSPSPGVFLSPGADSLVADLTCRLPISSNQPGSGGFVGFPTAAFTSDPGSNTTDAQHYGYGGLTYDRAVGKWLSVPRDAVTPDGARLVYWSGVQGDFHVVNASNRAEAAIGPRLNGPAWSAASAARQNWTSGGPPWGLLEASSDGVYATPPPYGSTGGGLWFFPYSGTAERQIASFGYWQAVGGGAAWGTRAPTVPQGATVSIVRVDLTNGASTEWFSQNGEDARVSGFDSAGHPVIVTSTESDFQVWLVDGPQHGGQLLNLPKEEPKQGYQSNLPVQSVLGDAAGVWIAASDGLYLYRNSRTQKVSTVTGQIGGGCGS